MGDPLPELAGVPPLGVVVRSNTGPSYMPRGTACISAICHQREEDSATLCSQGASCCGCSAAQSHCRGESLRQPRAPRAETSLQR